MLIFKVSAMLEAVVAGELVRVREWSGRGGGR